MNYEERYNELIDAIKEMQEANPHDEGLQNWVHDNVPELTESEDEKIRKAILSGLKYLETELEWDAVGDIDILDAYAWLEKQKEYESTDFEYVWNRTDCGDLISALDKYSEEAIINMCHAWYDKGIELERKSWLEKQDESNEERNDVVKCLINGMKFYYEDNEDATWGTDKWSMPVKHIIEVLEKQGCQKSVDKEFTFKSIPRLLEMIEPTDRAKSYCKKLIESLQTEGYATDAKIVGNYLKQMKGEKVAMATMEEQESGWSEEEQNRFFVKVVLSNCALSFISYLDAHKYEGKMCVSNEEWEDIENAFHNAMWDRLHRYYCKYIEKQSQKPQGKSALEAANEEKIDNQNCVKGDDKIGQKFKVGDIVQYITDSTDRRKIEEIDTLCNMYHTDSSPIMFEIEDEWKVVVNAEDVEQKPADKVEPKFKVKYAGSCYNVLEIKEIAGDMYYGIEDEPNHIDYVLPDNCEIISGYGVKENGSPYPTKPIVFSEQKPDNKVKPKFNVGEWIIQKNLGVYKIIEVCESWYEVISYNDGIQYSIGFDKENDCHLWTIADAKPGDVLAMFYESKNYILIYRGLYEKSFKSIMSVFCFLEEDTYYDETDMFHIINREEIITPATKEQRDTLEMAITNAGYRWDKEKLKLEKI